MYISSDNAGWARIFDLSNGTIQRYFFINAGFYGHLRTAFTVAGNAKEDRIDLVNGRTYYDGWHTLELIVAPGGYTTLYMDNEAVAYQSAGETTKTVLNELSNYNTCYIGTSVFQITGAADDGYFIGKMKGFSIAPGAMKPTMCQISYETNGGTAVDSDEATALPEELPTTTREGAKFEGWFTDEACTEEAVPGAEITEDVTLYAKWSHVHKLVSYGDSNGVYTAYCENDVLSDECACNGEQNALTLAVKDYQNPFSDEEKAAWEAAGLPMPELIYHLADGSRTTPENSGAETEGGVPTKPGKYELWVIGDDGAVAIYEFEIPESKQEEKKSEAEGEGDTSVPKTGDVTLPFVAVLGAGCVAAVSGLVARTKRQ